MFWQSTNWDNSWSLYDYGNGLHKLVLFKRLPRRKGCEFSKEKRANPIDEGRAEKDKQIIIDDENRFTQSISRTRSTIFELAFCNDFDYFCTLTIDSKKSNRDDLNGFVKDFGQFIRDLNKKRPEDKKIKYLIIPELHKKGGWHFHGLFSGLCENDLAPNKFGYLDWKRYSDKFGFFSCSPLKNKENACRYISKYITKDIAELSIPKGAHLYYCSQNLKRKTAICRFNFDNCFTDDFDFENDYVKIKWIRDNN